MVLALLIGMMCAQQTSLSNKQKRIAMDYFILDGYKAVALTCAETELQFVNGVPAEIDLCAKKALAFVQKMLKLVTDGKVIIFAQEERNVPSGLRWTGQNTDFIELIYGLHTKKCINDGDVSLKDLLTAFMQFLDFEKPLANCYITYRDIKMRLLDNRATFLQEMTNELNWRMKEWQGDRIIVNISIRIHDTIVKSMSIIVRKI